MRRAVLASLRRHWRGVAVFALAWTSLLFLRLGMMQDARVSLHDALRTGLWIGASYDAALVATVLTLGALALLAHRWLGRILTALLLATSFIASLSAALYQRFFGVKLDWWVVELHGGDVVQDRASIAALFDGWLEWSALFSGVALALACWPRQTEASLGLRLRRVLVLGALAGLFWSLPNLSLARHSSVPYATQIVRLWAFELWPALGAEPAAWSGQNGKTGYVHFDDPARLVLDFVATHALGKPSHPMADAPPLELALTELSSRWPLWRRIEPQPAATMAWRDFLGLPREGPIHVVLLMVESLRAFELEEPSLGPLVMPKLHQRLNQRAVYFRQAYSSSGNSGQTIRGHYSTLCSMYPNSLGAGEYATMTTLRARCLPELLRENGYRTLWLGGHSSDFHGMRAWELLHGTEKVYDRDDFEARGVTETLGEWGLADRPFLAEAMRVLEEEAQTGRPLFANVSTLSTHHPYSVVPGGELPPKLIEATASNEAYRGFLSRLRYSDEAVDTFLEALFKSALGPRTVVLIQGDHSTNIVPYVEQTPAGRKELRYRIPIALLTANLPRPMRIDRPVHQIDVAPTLLRLTGSAGPVTWVGRGLGSDGGSPFVFLFGDEFHYRFGERACYRTEHGAPLACFRLNGSDPLFATLSAEAKEPEESDGAFKLAHAVRQTVVENRFAPAQETAQQP